MDAALFNWLEVRGAGVLLHPTSLPGNQGVGTLGKASHRFLDFLQACSMSYWQLCPLGPTGFGDSPYQCFSAFAGNPYLIDLDDVVERGFLTETEMQPLRKAPEDRVDYGLLWEQKWKLLGQAHRRFVGAGRPNWNGEGYEEFLAAQQAWLEPYSLFMALKQLHGGRSWTEWPPDQRSWAKASSQAALLKQVEVSRDAHRFYQYVFFEQWTALRVEAARRHIQIIGDIPIFVAADSADVWANPELFDLDPASGLPRHVAGVPPDYFSADGQLWGNPLYRWEPHAADGYAWWCERMRASFHLYDVVRIDHFRGFDEYWQVPAGAKTARTGQWQPGPGRGLFEALQKAFPGAKIIAEDLGLLTPGVEQLRAATGLPGMAILQFAFGGKADNLYLPHNLTPNCVIYPGTHDNDTTRGWYATADDKTRDHVRRYFRIDGNEIGWDFIRAAYGSVAKLAIIALPDIMSLGSDCRLNTPGKPAGNWQWRYRAESLDKLFDGSARYLKELAELTFRENERANQPPPES